MGQMLSEPVTEKHTVSGGNRRVKYAASGMQGWRISYYSLFYSLFCSIFNIFILFLFLLFYFILFYFILFYFILFYFIVYF